MLRFRWLDSNRAKVYAHALSMREVEHAWQNRFGQIDLNDPKQGPYFESYGPCASGRIIKIVWRWNRIREERVVYVITAY